MGIRLEAADPVTLQPITAIRPGDEFAIVAYARDLRPQGQGVFSAYFDLEYSASLLVANGQITQRGVFTNGVEGDVLVPGTVDEVGGFSERLKPPASNGEQLLAAIPMRAKGIGVIELTTNAAESFGHDMLLYGDNASLPLEAVKYGSLRLEISNVTTDLPRPDVLDDDFVVSTALGEQCLERTGQRRFAVTSVNDSIDFGGECYWRVDDRRQQIGANLFTTRRFRGCRGVSLYRRRHSRPRRCREGDRLCAAQ